MPRLSRVYAIDVGLGKAAYKDIAAFCAVKRDGLVRVEWQIKAEATTTIEATVESQSLESMTNILSSETR